MTSRRLVCDLLAVTLIFTGASAVGQQFLSSARAKTMFEWELAPAVMVACGAGFTQPALETPGLQRFLSRTDDEMSCLDAVGRGTVQPTANAKGERYSIYAAGFALRLGGLSWRTLDAYQGLLFGLTMALGFGIFRLVVGPVLAVCGVVGLVWSDHVLALASFRDFGKAPAFFALWLVLAWLVSRNAERASGRLLAPAVLAGLLIGCGLGFRIDVLVFVPAFVVVIICGVPGFDRGALRTKGLAALLLIATFLVAGSPVLVSTSQGSNSSHVLVLGLMREFTRNLGLQPPSYDVGDHYTDSFSFALISTHASLVQHEREPGQFGSSQYDVQGGRLLADMARRFPADLMVRILGATAQAIRYPFDGASRGDYLRISPLNQTPVSRTVGLVRSAVLKALEGWSLLMATMVLLVVGVRSWRIGTLGVLLVLYFCGYSMLQFSRRHSFHLDLVGIGLYLVAARLALDFFWHAVGKSPGAAVRDVRQAIARSRRGAVGALLVVLGALGTLSLTRWYQQQHIIGTIEQTLAVGWNDARLVPEPLFLPTDEDGEYKEPWRDAAEGRLERWKSAVLFRLNRPSANGVRASGADPVQLEYLQVELNGSCGAPIVSVALIYFAPDSIFFRPYTRLIDVPVEFGPEPSRLLIPVYYHDGGTTFDGLAIPKEQVSCLTAVRTAGRIGDLPFPLLTAVLRPGWHDDRWYQRLQQPPEYTSAGTITSDTWRKRRQSPASPGDGAWP